jgi:ATP-dependent RNA helicase DeaD
MEFYTHRSGRTARAGKKGISIALVSRQELGKVKQIEKSMKSPMKRMMVPSGAEVCQKQLIALMRKVREVKVNDTEIEAFLPQVYEELNDLTKNDLIKRFASIEFNRFLDYYRNAPDLNGDQKRTERTERGDGFTSDRRDRTERSEGSDRGYSDRSAGGTRFFINLGKMDGLDKSKMLEVIDEFTGLEKKDIGQIDLMGAYSFFEVDKSLSDKVLKGFTGAELQGRQVRVEITEPRSGGGSSGGRSSRGDRDRPDRPDRPEGDRPRKRVFTNKGFENKGGDRLHRKRR